MENQDIIIISLTILLVYFLYQSNQANFAFLSSENSVSAKQNQEKITKLEQEVQYYQNLYQKRVEKDLEADQTTKITELTNQLAELETKYQDFRKEADKKEVE